MQDRSAIKIRLNREHQMALRRYCNKHRIGQNDLILQRLAPLFAEIERAEREDALLGALRGIQVMQQRPESA